MQYASAGDDPRDLHENITPVLPREFISGAPRNFPVTVMAGDLETVLDAFTPRTQLEDDCLSALRKALADAERAIRRHGNRPEPPTS